MPNPIRNGLRSTNAIGHQGTGIGIHSAEWAHYQMPSKGDTRNTFTYFDFNTADFAIRSARAVKGSVVVASTTYRKVMQYKCSNCQTVAPNNSNWNGCPRGSGRHNWTNVSAWNAGTVGRTTLYYDKGGTRTQVSFHAF